MNTTHNPLLELKSFGQSIWLDFIERGMTRDGRLAKLIDQDGLAGETSNPSIFEKVIGEGHDYDAAIASMARAAKSVESIYEKLTIEDIQNAADVFRQTYDKTEGRDGFVSLEVSPLLAHDSRGTVRQAKRLWRALNRLNVMIKVPATKEGLVAIRELTAEGINVNVTLLFGLDRYAEVADAYIGGIEDRVKLGRHDNNSASVASFFLSRIDVLVDPLLEQIIKAGGDSEALATKLHGQVAILSARAAYAIYKQKFESERFKALEASGAQKQRLLWASTSTKNPEYSDVKYVEALISRDTVNTLPLKTIDAYRDHGQPCDQFEGGVEDAATRLEQLKELGIDLDSITQTLEVQGVEKFSDAFAKLFDAIQTKVDSALVASANVQTFTLGTAAQTADERIKRLNQQDFATRLVREDATLWTNADPVEVEGRLGWLTIAGKMQDSAKQLRQFASEVRRAGFEHAIHIGMGGSSLAPLVLTKMFCASDSAIPVTVLDTTDPATISGVLRAYPIDRTLFIIASKSGTTLEPLLLLDYFYDMAQSQLGDKAGENFVAITDPGTLLAARAEQLRFRHVFSSDPRIGGRYSALSYFGLVPAALIGVDIERLLNHAQLMASDPSAGAALGAALSSLYDLGRDKVTFLTDRATAPLAMWLEQLLAESTGKLGRGLLPVVGEPPGVPAVYADDRIFVSIRLKGSKDGPLDETIDRLEAAGQPLITIELNSLIDIGQEFLRWEIATATVGSQLGINPFDQPNVQLSKDNTRALLETFETTDELPTPRPTLADEPLKFFAEEEGTTASEVLLKFLNRARPHDYIAIMAYLTEAEHTDSVLQRLRAMLRDRLRVATTVGYGPRFLHSTGQFHKGGPNTGLFIQLIQNSDCDLAIPAKPYSFGVVRCAAALGDYQALLSIKRRVIRIDIGSNTAKGLFALANVVETILGEKDE